ncbi:MAG: biotin/lipoyl-binding protein, partial [Planctomycetota bacterium]
MTPRLLAAAAVIAVLTAGGPPLVEALSAGEDERSAEQTSPGQSTTGQSTTRSIAAMPVEVSAARLVDAYETRKPYTGTLVAGRRSQIGFERGGKVVRLAVDEGERVSAGQVLAELDRRRLSASRRRVAAQLAEARAVLDELVAGPRKETIAAAAAEVRRLQAQVEVAQLNLRRRQQLVDTEAISQEEFDESFYAARVAQASYDAAVKQLEELETGTRAERIDAQRARVDALQAQLADADHEIEDTTLTAPFDGA